MNCLHNYVVNDTPTFLSQPDRIETVFEMLKPYFDGLFLKLPDGTQNFSILIKYFEGAGAPKKQRRRFREEVTQKNAELEFDENFEFDFVSSPQLVFEKMPTRMYEAVKELIALFISKVNEYKKFQANFILETVSIQIFNDEKTKKQKKAEEK